MRRSLFVAIPILFLSILTLASPAHAQLVNGTSASGDTVIDTVNNMEWLDVSETIGLTPTTALAIHADAGWTWATAAEVNAVLDQFFIDSPPDIPEFRPLDFANGAGTREDLPQDQYLDLVALFGSTGFNGRFFGGLYDDEELDSATEAMFWNDRFTSGGPVTIILDSDSDGSNFRYGVFLVRPLGDSGSLSWTNFAGGVEVNSNQIAYSGSPTGWNNSVNSNSFSSAGINDNFELQFLISSDPATALWAVGLGAGTDTGTNWRDVDYMLRNSNGRLQIYEDGTWQSNGPQLAQGDRVSIVVNAGVIEYRHNGSTVYTSSYSGTPGFYVDTAFKNGAATLDVSLISDNSPPPPPPPPPPSGSVPITSWSNFSGGVTSNSNAIQYSGTPTGWRNSVNSDLLSNLGATDDYTVSWTIGTNPANGIWVVGLGENETGSNYRDIEHAIRNFYGVLQIYEGDTYVKNIGPLSVGDKLSLRVSALQLEYLLNDAVIHARPILGTENFYIDFAFKEGLAELTGFALTIDGAPPPPPTGDIPITSWSGAVGGVTTSGDSVSYSGSPTGWVNSVNSAPLASLGAGDYFALTFRVTSDPSNSLWVIGLSFDEGSSNWRDIDFALRNTNGILTVYIDGVYYPNGLFPIETGHLIRIDVGDGGIRLGTNLGYYAKISHPEINANKHRLYIDTAFKYGAASFGEFVFWNK